ncbi:hypothetical protein CLOSYM_03732, partial [[Clostridium] symbiosum ATCC 14940]
QARKSLWIETAFPAIMDQTIRVRLVRACGSKPKLQLRILPHIKGQARKSLWIETPSIPEKTIQEPVRLVRACGSKPRTAMLSCV